MGSSLAAAYELAPEVFALLLENAALAPQFRSDLPLLLANLSSNAADQAATREEEPSATPSSSACEPAAAPTNREPVAHTETAPMEARARPNPTESAPWRRRDGPTLLERWSSAAGHGNGT
nr:unnamed protein product [Digitaria exilis]